MSNRQRAWIWASAIVSMATGLILVWNDSGAGWFLVIMGITYLGTLTRGSQAWAESNPDLSRWGLIGMAVLLILLVGVAIAVFLRN